MQYINPDQLITLHLADGGHIVLIHVERIQKLQRHPCGCILSIKWPNASLWLREAPEQVILLAGRQIRIVEDAGGVCHGHWW
jgi:hypothetical protein